MLFRGSELYAAGRRYWPRSHPGGPKADEWLSGGLETLIDERSQSDQALAANVEYDFDVVIVGSGYGGAIAAAELSGCTDEGGKPLRVCVLERGREYLQGAFPTRQADLAGHVRFATPNAPRQRGVYDGLYDIRWSEDAVAVVASGLGGGSLINAGVMESAPPRRISRSALAQAHPRSYRSDAIGGPAPSAFGGKSLRPRSR